MVDSNYNFECDWLTELSNNNLASELVENRSFFEPITTEKIVVFMIMEIVMMISSEKVVYKGGRRDKLADTL